MYIIPNLLLIIILSIIVIEFIKKTNSKLDTLDELFDNLDIEHDKLKISHQINIKILQQDFMNKLEFLRHTDTESFISNAINSPDILILNCFKPYNQFDADRYNQDLRFAKNPIRLTHNVVDANLHLDDIKHIICSKVATYLFENNFVTNKLNITEGIVTFKLNTFNLIK